MSGLERQQEPRRSWCLMVRLVISSPFKDIPYVRSFGFFVVESFRPNHAVKVSYWHLAEGDLSKDDRLEAQSGH